MNNSTSKCRKCGKPVYWHKSRNDKNYPCDSDNPRDFHKCAAAEQPAKVEPKPITPSYFEGTTEERLANLERQVAQLSRTIQEVQKRPIDDSDLGF